MTVRMLPRVETGGDAPEGADTPTPPLYSGIVIRSQSGIEDVVPAGADGEFLRMDSAATSGYSYSPPAPTGALMLWPTDTPPGGWLLCDGSAVSRTTYADLFAVVGETFGVGDGSTTFNLPDLRHRVAVGKDSGDAAFDAIGETGGAKAVAGAGSVAAPVFTGSALAGHSHGPGTLAPSAHAGAAVDAHTTLSRGSSGSVADVLNGPGSHAVTQPNAHTMAGSSEAVSGGTPAGTNSAPEFTGAETSVLQPYLVLNYIIRV